MIQFRNLKRQLDAELECLRIKKRFEKETEKVDKKDQEISKLKAMLLESQKKNQKMEAQLLSEQTDLNVICINL